MIKISVTSTEVRNQRGTAKASGKAYDLNFQTVWAHTSDRNGNPNPFPEKVEIILEKNEQGAALFLLVQGLQKVPACHSGGSFCQCLSKQQSMMR